MQPRRVVLAIPALPVLCAPRTVAGDLSAVAHGPRPGMVSTFRPHWQPRLPRACGNGTSLGPRVRAFEKAWSSLSPRETALLGTKAQWSPHASDGWPATVLR